MCQQLHPTATLKHFVSLSLSLNSANAHKLSLALLSLRHLPANATQRHATQRHARQLTLLTGWSARGSAASRCARPWHDAKQETNLRSESPCLPPPFSASRSSQTWRSSRRGDYVATLFIMASLIGLRFASQQQKHEFSIESLLLQPVFSHLDTSMLPKVGSLPLDWKLTKTAGFVQRPRWHTPAFSLRLCIKKIGIPVSIPLWTCSHNRY